MADHDEKQHIVAINLLIIYFYITHTLMMSIEITIIDFEIY